MMTFLVGDEALQVATSGRALAAPRRVRVVAVLADGRLRVRYLGAPETVSVHLRDLRPVVPLSGAGKPKDERMRASEEGQGA